MDPKRLKKIREGLGLTQREMSSLLDTPFRTYQDWELGNRRIPGICEVAIDCLLRCKSAFKARRKKDKKIEKIKEVYIMGREVILFETEERKSVNDIAAFLRQLADKLESGNVKLRTVGKELVLDIPRELTLEVKVEEEEKKGKIKQSLEVEIEWIKGQGLSETGGVELA